jgi:hypothetical protein
LNGGQVRGKHLATERKMHMNKHTPGPWQVEPNPFESAPMVSTENRTIAKVLYWGGSEDGEVNANAHLIAAAPELLEALEDILWSLDHLDLHEIADKKNSLSDVIAKAKGES